MWELISLLHNGIYFSEILALTTNTIVLHLSLTERNKDLKEYRNLLLMNIITDYCATMIGIFNQENVEMTDGLWVHILGSPANMLPKNIHWLLVGAYSFKLSITVDVTPIQFYYRWRLIAKKRKPSVQELVALFGVAFFNSIVFMCLFGYCFLISDYKYPDHSFLMSNPYIFNDENPNPTLVVGDLKSIPMLILISMTAIGNTLIVGMIFYFTYDTYQTMQKLRSQMHHRTAKLHSQMNRMLFMQTAAVFLCALLPLGSLVVVMFTAINVPGIGTFINMTLSYIPVINPISTLLCVKRFRTRFLHIIWPFVHRSQVAGYDTSASGVEQSKDVTPMTIA
ncbi:hypothetical protein M3Y94_01059000 [Aphelenchoides besseyi]|nr:hypothetical protein M3Y94_01059000 [Aphelenchoides besseyi]KAI6224164.1 hypothetical protein M3Y95_00854100 [Aphelenchoides besseyi]